MTARSLLLSAALLLLVGCPKPKPPPQAVPDEEPARPVVGIDRVQPSTTAQGRAVTVTVKGFGFAPGSDVFLNSNRARGVDVVSDDELTFRATEDLAAGSYDVRVETPKGDAAVSRAAFRVEAPPKENTDCKLMTVQFEFNEAQLTNNARQVLADNARCMEMRSLDMVRLEGHADERGSTEYNLSLGERRASSVKKYLESLGVDGGALRTLSYGEERPSNRGSGEEAWAENRRVEFKTR